MEDVKLDLMKMNLLNFKGKKVIKGMFEQIKGLEYYSF